MQRILQQFSVDLFQYFNNTDQHIQSDASGVPAVLHWFDQAQWSGRAYRLQLDPISAASARNTPSRQSILESAFGKKPEEPPQLMSPFKT